jgi:hypothetical protein
VKAIVTAVPVIVLRILLTQSSTVRCRWSYRRWWAIILSHLPKGSKGGGSVSFGFSANRPGPFASHSAPCLSQTSHRRIENRRDQTRLGEPDDAKNPCKTGLRGSRRDRPGPRFTGSNPVGATCENPCLTRVFYVHRRFGPLFGPPTLQRRPRARITSPTRPPASQRRPGTLGVPRLWSVATSTAATSPLPRVSRHASSRAPFGPHDPDRPIGEGNVE